MKGGDHLHIPRNSREVTVIGEVQSATSHVFVAALSWDDCPRMSGGTTEKAGDGCIYMVRANGSIETGGGSRWLRQSGAMPADDTIVVPLDAERIRPLAMWTALTPILLNHAVAVAAVNSN